MYTLPNRSSSSRPNGSPSHSIEVSSPTIQYSVSVLSSAPSIAVTLNSTCRIPPRAMKISPFFSGLYFFAKYGFTNTSNKSPLNPSTVSANGNTSILFAYFTSGNAVIVTASPNRNLLDHKDILNIIFIYTHIIYKVVY